MVALNLIASMLAWSPAVKAGDLVCDPRSDRTALVIMDMQPDFVDYRGNQSLGDNKNSLRKLLGVQTDLIRSAVIAKIPILFIEYEGSNSFRTPYHSTFAELKAAAGTYALQKTVRKPTDGFLDPMNPHRRELIDFLRANSVGTLVMAGANGGACVRDSINQALARECSVVAYADAIADFNYTRYIYPYRTFYNIDIQACEHCRFQVTGDRQVIRDAMKDGRSWPQVLDRFKPSDAAF